MTIRCPFCNASEDNRVEGVDENSKRIILLMFDCPFFFKLPQEVLASDQLVQNYLDEWRTREGELWLESIGPILKARELKNMNRQTLDRTRT
jgi:hypothetical protein